MKKSIGMIEFKSIAKGFEATDAMLKAAHVELIMSMPICPGKFISLISGDVGAVENAIQAGKMVGDYFTIEHFVIPNLCEAVFPALTGTADVNKITSLGVIETISAITSIAAADIAAKASNVQLLEIRLARGLCGKGFVVMTGEVAAVQSAITACENQLKDTGGIISAVAIASPTKELIAKVL